MIRVSEVAKLNEQGLKDKEIGKIFNVTGARIHQIRKRNKIPRVAPVLKRKDFTCPQCGKKMLLIPSDKRIFCNRKCRHKNTKANYDPEKIRTQTRIRARRYYYRVIKNNPDKMRKLLESNKRYQEKNKERLKEYRSRWYQKDLKGHRKKKLDYYYRVTKKKSEKNN